MNLFRRGMIFATFFGCCLAIALLVASLGTRQWVNAKAKRTSNPHESEGRIHFGLFSGKKELNVAYGWRSYEVDVIHLLKYEPEFLNYPLWICTTLCVCVSLLFAVISAIFAAINTATTTSRCLFGSGGLYASNIASMALSSLAACLWIAQFYLKIKDNVMTREDRDNMWTSAEMAELGYSFWFVVGAAVVNFVNVIVIFIANSEKDVENVVPVLEEKTNGVIMLY